MNGRQIALLVWIAVAALYVLLDRSTRSSVLNVVVTAMTPKLSIPALLSIGWNLGIVYLLHRVGFWAPSMSWDTAAFVLVGCTGLVWRMHSSKDFSKNFYVSMSTQTLAFSALVGTVAGTYTFSLPIELALIPFLFLLGGVQALAEANTEYATIVKPVRAVIAFTGAMMLLRAVAGAIADYRGFFALQTVQSLFLLFVLTVAYLPFLYLFKALMTYETACLPMMTGPNKPLSVRAYATLKMFLIFGLDLAGLDRFRSGIGRELRRTTTRAAVRDVFARARSGD